MSFPTLRGDPEALFNVSEAPRFVSHSGGIGWQGGFFTEVVTSSAGQVDHLHDLYCVQRTFDGFRVRRGASRRWERIPVGWSLWQPGDEQRGDWEGSARSQFLFLSPARVESLLEVTLKDPSARWRQPEIAPIIPRLLDAMAADLADGSPAGALVGDCLLTALCASLFSPGLARPAVGALSSALRTRVLDRIEHDLDRPLALADLA